MKLTTKTHLVFPIVTDILNKTEIELVQVYNNYTLNKRVMESTPIDIALDTAGNTLLNIKSKVKVLKESLAKEQRDTSRSYFREITSGTSSLLIVAIIVILILVSKRLQCMCLKHKGAPKHKTTNESKIDNSPENDIEPEELELAQIPSIQVTPTTGGNNDQKSSPDLRITRETPFRI